MPYEPSPLIVDLYRAMPKLELHAHLSGSVNSEMLLALESANQVNISEAVNVSDSSTIGARMSTAVTSGDSIDNLDRGLSQVFETFGKIHEAIRTPEQLTWVTEQVIEQFLQDNVIYLELRTSPKRVHNIASKDEYMESVLSAIMRAKEQRWPIVVKLLVSLDRQMGPEEGYDTVELADRWTKRYPQYVVGLDVSGNPTNGSYDWILPLLKKARSLGLRTSCHLPEVVNPVEVIQILNFKPDRAGHAVFIHPLDGGNEELWRRLLQSKIPIEVCITSNLKTGVTRDLMKHYVQYLQSANHPYVIGTDDSGVFDTTLTAEYCKLTQVLPSFIIHDTVELCKKSVDYAFATDTEKDDMRNKISTWSESIHNL